VEYRSIVRRHVLPTFGDTAIEDVTVDQVERWRGAMTCSPRTKNKALTVLHGVLKRAQRVWKVTGNAAAEVEKVRERPKVDIDVFSSEEVWALVRAAASEQDGAIYLTAAFTGLRRGELIALRWRDVDFAGSILRVRASYSFGVLSSPKSGRARVVPMAPDVAEVLARLGQRGRWTTGDDLVFPGSLGSHLDGTALYRRYIKALARAGLRPLRFHDLRHTFGTRTIAVAVHPPREGVDGSFERVHHDALPALHAEAGRRRPRGQGVLLDPPAGARSGRRGHGRPRGGPAGERGDILDLTRPPDCRPPKPSPSLTPSAVGQRSSRQASRYSRRSARTSSSVAGPACRRAFTTSVIDVETPAIRRSPTNRLYRRCTPAGTWTVSTRRAEWSSS
jgi:integrase